MIQLYSNYDSIANENCSEVKRSLQLNSILNSKTMISDKANSSKGKGKSSRSKQSKKPKDRKPTSYITDYYAVNEKLYAYIKGLVKDFNPATQHFLFHVFASYMLSKNLKEDTWIPIPRKTLDKKFHDENIDIQGLIDAKLIERTENYSIMHGICYCYRIQFSILKETEKYYPKTSEEFESLNYVNLIDGKPIKSLKNVLTHGENKHSLPVMVNQGIKGIKRTVFDFQNTEKYLAQSAKGISTDKQWRKHLNDLRCNETVMRNAKDLGGGLKYYVPAYESQKSGRVSELEGGLQSCSRAMKKAAFTFSNCYNYDLKSSQLYGLRYLSEKAGMDTEPINIFLSIDKQLKADEVGITKKCYKNCLYAFVMGATTHGFEDTPRYWDKKSGKYKPEFFCLSVIKYLLEEADRLNKEKNIMDLEADKTLALELLDKFNESVDILQKHLEKFYEWLVDDYCKANQTKKGTIKNLAEMSFNLNEYKNSKGEYIKKRRRDLYRKLTAFFLQGIEAAFIHYLSKEEIQTKYNYEVISNQHDGVITIGVIPDAAVKEAKEVLSLPYAYLEIKPICDSREETWWLYT